MALCGLAGSTNGSSSSYCCRCQPTCALLLLTAPCTNCQRNNVCTCSQYMMYQQICNGCEQLWSLPTIEQLCCMYQQLFAFMTLHIPLPFLLCFLDCLLQVVVWVLLEWEQVQSASCHRTATSPLTLYWCTGTPKPRQLLTSHFAAAVQAGE